MPVRDRLFSNERPWFTALCFAGGFVAAAGFVAACCALGWWIRGQMP